MFKFDVPGSDNVFLSLSVWFAFSKQTKFYILLKHKRILGCAPAESNTARAYTTSILCHRVHPELMGLYDKDDEVARLRPVYKMRDGDYFIFYARKLYFIMVITGLVFNIFHCRWKVDD